METMAKTISSNAAETRVTRAARDELFAVYDSIHENSELMDTLPAKNRSDVNFLPSQNASIPTGNPHSPTEVRAEHSQKHLERAYGLVHSRGGEPNTTTGIRTSLNLVGSYGPYRLWLPNGWFDWSVFHLGDSDSQEETQVVRVSSSFWR